MIIVHGTIPLKPEQREEGLRLAQWMADRSQAEHGCISYEFYVGLSDPNELLLFQEWQDHDALMEHFRTEHMEEFLKALPDVVDGEIHTRRYAVDIEADGEDLDEPIEFDLGERDQDGEADPPIIH